MKANKHEIDGYIYVTSEEKPKNGEYGLGQHESIYKFDEETSTFCVDMFKCKKIILTNNPDLSIQQLTLEEVEYLKGVDSFEVIEERIVLDDVNYNFDVVDYKYKILIPQETKQPKESIEEIAEICYYEMKVLNPKGGIKEFIRLAVNFGYNHAKQTLYTESDMLDLLMFVECPKDEGHIKEIKSVLNEWFIQFKTNK